MSDTHLAEDASDRMIQRTVPAAAGGVRTTAPNSVFAIGGTGSAGADAAPEPQADAGGLSWLERARKTFEACGELSCVQLQEALGCTRSRATALIVELRESREIDQLRKDGVVPIYGRRRQTGGFRTWLGRQAEGAPAEAPPAAAKRRGRKAKATAAPAPAKAPRRPRKPRAAAAPAPALPAVVRPAVVQQLVNYITPPADDLALGIFSTGEISIEADGQVMRLNPLRARKLLDWALRVDALMSVGI